MNIDSAAFNQQVNNDATQLVIELLSEITPEEARNLLSQIARSEKETNALVRLLVASAVTNQVVELEHGIKPSLHSLSLLNSAAFFAGIRLCWARKTPEALCDPNHPSKCPR